MALSVQQYGLVIANPTVLKGEPFVFTCVSGLIKWGEAERDYKWLVHFSKNSIAGLHENKRQQVSLWEIDLVTGKQECIENDMIAHSHCVDIVNGAFITKTDRKVTAWMHQLKANFHVNTDCSLSFMKASMYRYGEHVKLSYFDDRLEHWVVCEDGEEERVLRVDKPYSYMTTMLNGNGDLLSTLQNFDHGMMQCVLKNYQQGHFPPFRSPSIEERDLRNKRVYVAPWFRLSVMEEMDDDDKNKMVWNALSFRFPSMDKVEIKDDEVFFMGGFLDNVKLG